LVARVVLVQELLAHVDEEVREQGLFTGEVTVDGGPLTPASAARSSMETDRKPRSAKTRGGANEC